MYRQGQGTSPTRLCKVKIVSHKMHSQSTDLLQRSKYRTMGPHHTSARPKPRSVLTCALTTKTTIVEAAVNWSQTLATTSLTLRQWRSHVGGHRARTTEPGELVVRAAVSWSQTKATTSLTLPQRRSHVGGHRARTTEPGVLKPQLRQPTIATANNCKQLRQPNNCDSQQTTTATAIAAALLPLTGSMQTPTESATTCCNDHATHQRGY